VAQIGTAEQHEQYRDSTLSKFVFTVNVYPVGADRINLYIESAGFHSLKLPATKIFASDGVFSGTSILMIHSVMV